MRDEHVRIKAAIKAAKECEAHKHEPDMTRQICEDIAVENGIKKLICTDRLNGVFAGNTRKRRLEF